MTDSEKRFILPAAGLKRLAVWAGLEFLFFSGSHRFLRPFLGGLGAILTFHRVRPASPGPFQPNRRLEVTPEFLDKLIKSIRHSGVEIISLDEMYRSMTSGEQRRPFVVLTFDDGYRDNLEYAWPILTRHQAPFTIFVCSDFADGTGELWWMGLADTIENADRLVVQIGESEKVFECNSLELKYSTFGVLYALMRSQETETQIREFVRGICAGSGVDLEAQCRDACMNWTEIQRIAADPLTTIGCHTADHLVLSKATAQLAYAAMHNSRRAIEAVLGRSVDHFAYPFGDKSAAGPREFEVALEVGFRTAVTTRRGVIFPEHGAYLTALPRIPVNGNMQRARYTNVFVSGAPTAIANRFRKLDVS